MSADIFLLVLTAAFFHAFWNFTARKVAGDVVVLWLALLSGCFLLFPAVCIVVGHHGIQGSFPSPAAPYVIATGIIHALYFVLLGRAYEKGEISLVYPVARGTGIGLAALLAPLLLRESISLGGVSGIVMVLSGILFMAFRRQDRPAPDAGYRLALGTGVSIAAYSLVDKTGVGIMNPVIYLWLMGFVAALLLLPFILKYKKGLIWKTIRSFPGAVLTIGAGSMGAYLMILYAFRSAPVSYVMAAREFAVVIGAALGFFFLREKMTPWKLSAIVLIMSGVILIKAG